ncbi:MAG: LytTR family DNA-binding domain-containing protein [Tannerella sp.]|jgi:DNA-binding LytR/AlgR family response regulator|nr:LytTR family DNA-binding domain-containing protein [Tannerella sp.]
MKCIAIDDEPLALKLLAHYCSQTPSIQLLGLYTDPLDGLSYIRSLKPDLLFLDINMPEISGVNIAKSLEKETLVIFMSAHREYAVEGFELDVIEYLLKPFCFERFMKAYTKAEERFLSGRTVPVAESTHEGKTISFKYNYQNIQLPLSAIIYIEAFDNYIKIITSAKTYMPVMTMKTIQTLLPAEDFVRIHKSFIVAVGKIKSFNSEKVVTDRKQIPVGRRFRKNFMDIMRYGTPEIR